MNNKERKREHILIGVKFGAYNLKKAAKILHLSYSHTKRLWSQYKKHGPKSLISKKRGKKSNRAVSEETKKEIAKIISTEFYNCKPLYVSEKLKEDYGIVYSSEFIRQLMTKHNLWFPKMSKVQLHQMRERRSCIGELIQGDASKHDWLEGRLIHYGKVIKPQLHIFIDDASSIIYGAYFDYEETTYGYFKAAQPYFEEKGIPLSLYVDKRGTFKVNSGKRRNLTQFARAMKELDVEIIFAHSPQAKGRVERAFGTLQERLVWEMRRKNISTLEEANEFLPHFLKQYNKKFAKKPASTFDAHRQLDHKKQLKYILCHKEKRIVNKNLEVQYDNSIFQLEVPRELEHRIKGIEVFVITPLDEEELKFEFEGKFLKYRRYEDTPFVPQQPEPLEFNKTKTRARKPSKHHPWRNFKLSMKRAASIVVTVLTSIC